MSNIAEHARGVLKNLYERDMHMRVRSTFNPPTVSYSVAQAVQPVPTAAEGTIVRVTLKVETQYTHWFGEQHEGALSHQQENALRSISSFLYDDVIKALYHVQQRIGDGNRYEAMELVSGLIRELRGG